MQEWLKDLDAILITEASNLLYFTDYKNADAYALFLGNEKYYFTDERYFEDAQNKLPDYIIRSNEEFLPFISASSIKKLGIEGSLNNFICEDIKANGVQIFVNIDLLIQKKRAIKTPQEIEFIAKAQSITDKTFTEILPTIKEGMTETELAGILESLLYVNGADELAFTSIVAFGKNTSMPHAIRSDTKLANGSLITLDFGAKYNGYCSDMTRTIAFGNIPDEQKSIYNHVLTAQQMALSIVFAGMTGKECDTMARKYFEENGLSKYFIHTLGHGVGLDIHEYPRLAQNSSVIMEQNMVVTIEPGLYFENNFGVRIEDLIYFDKTDIINLTKSPKKLIII